MLIFGMAAMNSAISCNDIIACFFFRYNYDPFQQSLNDNPDSELYINKGDYILVWGETDEVS